MKKGGFTTPDLAGYMHPLKRKTESGYGKMVADGCGRISLPGRTYGGINRRTGYTLYQANQVRGSDFMIIQPIPIGEKLTNTCTFDNGKSLEIWVAKIKMAATARSFVSLAKSF